MVINVEEPDNLIRISISIPKETYDWLENNKNINRSKLFRDAIERIKNPVTKNISPLMFLASIMGIVFSIALIGIATLDTPIVESVRAMLALLGGVLAIATAFCYYREHKRVQAINNEG